MKLSPIGLNLILEFENKLTKLSDGRYAAYRCPAGVPTIYAGCTEGVHMGMVVTEQEGEAMFAREIAKFENAVTLACTRQPNQHQFDALTSLAYNIGESGLRSSTALRMFNAGRFDTAAEAFGRWNKARKNGKGPRVEMRGLTRRRKAEAALFLTPVDEAEPEPMPQRIEPPGMSDAAKGGIAAGGLGGGLVLTDPVGLSSTLVAVKGNAVQLMPAGLSLTTWLVPVLIIAGAAVLLYIANRRAVRG